MPNNSAYIITSDHAQNERIFEELLARVTEVILNQTPGGPSSQVIVNDTLDSTDKTMALSAKQGNILKNEIVNGLAQVYNNIVNNVTSESPNHFLSAKVGNALHKRIEALENTILGGGGAGTAIPSGVIVMWSGTIDNVPSGWALCDGNDGRPNLLDKFVKGIANTSINPGNSGGNNSTILETKHLPAHTHNILHKHIAKPHSHTNEHNHHINIMSENGGSHEHEFVNDPSTWKSILYKNNNIISVRHDHGGDNIIAAARKKMGNAPNDYIFSNTTKISNVHSHKIRADTENNMIATGETVIQMNAFDGNSGITGENVAIDNRPAYYELAFIIKL